MTAPIGRRTAGTSRDGNTRRSAAATQRRRPANAAAPTLRPPTAASGTPGAGPSSVADLNGTEVAAAAFATARTWVAALAGATVGYALALATLLATGASPHQVTVTAAVGAAVLLILGVCTTLAHLAAEQQR